MSATTTIVAASVLFVLGAWLVIGGWRQERPSLRRTVRRLRAEAPRAAMDGAGGPWRLVDRVGARVMTAPVVDERVVRRRTLRLVGRSPERHVGLLVAAAVAGFLAPPLAVAMLRVFGPAPLGLAVPLAASLLGALAAPALLQLATVNEAEQVGADLRHQLSAYLDMVTMLLAGNTGHEGALEHAARAGDGLLFRELRRRMREVSTTGDSLVQALALVADDYGLVELEQVAATTALSAAEGAPVARTLAAKCSTLRSTLAADHEAMARVRNDKVTPPLVGMALLFMALIIYPALDLT